MNDKMSGGWSAYMPYYADPRPARSELDDDGGLFDRTTGPRIVALGALCGASPSASGDDAGVERFWVVEFAVLGDGRKVILSDDRGFSFSGPIGPTPAPPLTVEDVVDTVRVVVLPDPDDGEEHPWAELAVSARRRGLEVTEHDLRNLRYDIEFTDDLTRRLRRAT